jgi:outer membrane protein insertion porin family
MRPTLRQAVGTTILATSLFLASASMTSHVHAQDKDPTNDTHSNRYSWRKVSEIRYIGLRSITPRDLETSLPVSPGDRWEAEMSSKLRDAVVAYYAQRGFYSAQVTIQETSRDDRSAAITVRVDEGKPCLIEWYWIDDPPHFSSKSGMMRFKRKIDDIIKLSPGDRYDKEQLADKLRRLREWLESQDYIMANTENVETTYSADKTSVRVVFKIEYNDRVTFGFQGNTQFTQGELNELIAQVRATGLGKDYVGAIQRRLVEGYKNRAYNNIKIEANSRDNAIGKHVTFYFNEGVRSELVDLSFEGLSSQNTSIAKEVFTKGVSRLVQRGFYVEKDIEKGILIVLEDLRARGYLGSRLIAKSVQPVKSPAKTVRVKVVVQLLEGEQTTVGKIELTGVHHLDRAKALELLGVKEEQPFNPYALEEGLQKFRNAHIADGFLDFSVSTSEDEIVTFTDSNRIANVQLAVSEGERIRIGEIRVQGLELTKEYVVTREITLKSGDWWLGPQISLIENNLRKLGLFSEIKILPMVSPRGPGYRDLTIQFKEVDPGAFEAGPGFRSDLGVRAFAKLSYSNILGRNWIGALSVESNRRVNDQYRFIEYNVDASFLEPRFFGTKLAYNVSLTSKKQRFPPDFNAVTTQFMTGFERRFPGMLSGVLSTKLNYKLERIRQFDVVINGVLSADDNQSLLIGSVVPSITLDTRDSPFTTTSGVKASISLEYAHPTLAMQPTHVSTTPAYQKWNAATHFYIPVTKDIVWSNVVSGGFARSNISGRPIPLIKLFRLGGFSTIRGFSEDSINADAENILGTLTFLNLRTQVDFPFIGDLKLAPFFDAGNLYIDKRPTVPFFRMGTGFGLHYMTPVGPVNLDWGFKINQQPAESPMQIHFSVGLI